MIPPKTLPSREKMAEIRELLKLHWTTHDIVEKVWGRRDTVCTKIVKAAAIDWHGFDPDVDEVAVKRALEGDRSVWESLTHYERREVMVAVADRRYLEESENRVERAELEKALRDNAYRQANAIVPDWVRLLASAAGMTPRDFLAQSKTYDEARVL